MSKSFMPNTFDVCLVTIEKDKYEVRSVGGNTHLGGEDFDNRMVSYFVELNMELFEKCIGPVKKCLKDAKMDKNEVDEVVLVGGSSRIPKVQQMLQDFFGGKKLNKSINTDEAVAYGAAVQAAMLSGTNDNNYVLTDVTPLSLGIENNFREMSVLIPRNTPIPTKKERMFTTTKKNQQEVLFNVYEGERTIARDNNLLGSFELVEIPAAPKRKRVIDINVSFEIDADGIMKCYTEELTTKRKKGISISYQSGRLSREQVDRMIEAAEKFKDDDEQKRRKVKVMNDLENYAHDKRLLLRCHGGKIARKERREMEDAIDQAVKWMDWNNLLSHASMFEEKMKELENICEPIIAKIQKLRDDTRLHETAQKKNIEIDIIDID
ncbi:heat shock cognate 70 kDa protein-like [Beta vulgaris subsp. vulgaris]|uniref:heat shock cognate 70 kDa protein-like n=1 Tax=Beta vulgaris subsp. vulgaris TaxID=3555 RepID=UPI002547D015|nr:heat shock cognate 70 kDa protein-like [Beta vulgaris subsp. vulgaris]